MENKACYTVSQLESKTDDELIELNRNGELMSSEVLIKRYKNLIRAKARQYFLIGADCEDVVQEGMLGFYKAIRDYKPESDASFKVFAEMCIVRQIITAIKTANRKKHMPLNSYVSLNTPVGEDESRSLESIYCIPNVLNPEQVYIGRESAEDLHKLIKEALSSFEYAVFEQYISGISYTVIAEQMGKPMKSIDNALQRIKKKIEKCIENRQ
ncbi:MAG: RNA polymerase sporulation sigma factor SigH [Eubacteriales bacterium]|nr:RNA polymerase sporulation sigma factor SigH [Eubacteriales bacterium]